MNLFKAVRVQDHHLIWFENPSYRVLQVSYISAKLVMWVLVRRSLTDQVNLLCTVGFLGVGVRLFTVVYRGRNELVLGIIYVDY